VAGLAALPLFHRVAGTRVVVLGDGPAGEAKRRLVERAGGICCAETEAHHARLAFVALDDPRAAEAAALRLRTKGLLVNVADRPELCDFIVPSILDRDPMLVAVSTGGASAGLAKHVRLRLERLLPPSLGRLAQALHGAREDLRTRWPDPDERRRALDAALTEGGALDPLLGGSADAVAGWLAAPGEPQAARCVEIMLASADPDDLTLRHARVLGEADTVLHEPGVPAAILDRARADAVRRTLPAEPPTDGVTVVLRHASGSSPRGN
jgi:uroporphyrin-III C-methyltransferase / precorrin-2 dehydrogenase / sirohydrochlorin ferrochelatase